MHVLACLLLGDRQNTIADVLPAHAHHVTAPLPRVEQQHERKVRTGAGLVVSKEGCDVLLFPGQKARTLVADLPHTLSRIVTPPAQFDSMAPEKVDHAQHVIGGGGCVGLPFYQRADMPGFHLLDGPVPVIVAEAFDDAAIGRLGGGAQAGKVGSLVVARDQRGKAAGCGLALADCQLLALLGSLVCRHELRRPGQAGKRRAGISGAAIIGSHLAMPVLEYLAVFGWSSQGFHRSLQLLSEAESSRA